MSATVRQRRLPAARRRDQLLVAALSCFGAQGFHDTSMDDIAEEAGVTKPVLYQHFPSKRMLYVELLGNVGDNLRQAIADSALTATGPGQRVSAGFGAYFRFVCEHTSSFNLLFNSAARQGDEFSEVIRQLEDDIATMIGDLIDAPVERDHRELLGYGIVGLAEVTARQWVLRSETAAARHGGPRILDPEEGARLAARLSDLVWAGLRALPADDAPHGVGRGHDRGSEDQATLDRPPARRRSSA